jgi:predicted metal-dependent phosphoesterase TrpH
MLNVKPLFDMHSHSTASDGKLSPRALVCEAARKGIRALAVTDHDTIAAYSEAEEAARECGLFLIHGVEIEINWSEFAPLKTPPVAMEELSEGALVRDTGTHRREFHLLGLGISAPSPDFLALMAELRDSREKRNLLMIERMKELGLPADLDEIYSISGTSFIGRPHFAEYLVQKKVVKNCEAAFKKYLAKGEVLFVPRRGADLERALRVIKESGGISVLAHPNTLYVSWGHLTGMLPKLREAGIDAIEAWHPNCTVHESERFTALAKANGFCVSAGSDYHGEGRRARKLGESSGGKKITAALYDFSPVAAGLTGELAGLAEMLREAAL